MWESASADWSLGLATPSYLRTAGSKGFGSLSIGSLKGHNIFTLFTFSSNKQCHVGKKILNIFGALSACCSDDWSFNNTLTSWREVSVEICTRFCTCQSLMFHKHLQCTVTYPEWSDATNHSTFQRKYCHSRVQFVCFLRVKKYWLLSIHLHGTVASLVLLLFVLKVQTNSLCAHQFA